MTQTIDPIKLKAAAEHLEWVLRQYPNEPAAMGMLSGLESLISAAKNMDIHHPIDWIPFGYTFADGEYHSYKNPNVEDAYCDFAAELRGGRDEQEKQLIAKLEAIRQVRERQS